MVVISATVCLGIAIPSGLVAAAINSGSPDNSALIAHDGFSRSVASGLGTADQGGAYTTYGSPLSVSGGKAQVGSLALSKSEGAWLPQARALEAQAQVSLVMPAISAARSGLYFAAEARHQADGRTYRGKLVVGAGGRVALNVSRTDAHSVETSLGDAPLPWVATSNESVEVETAVTGTNPTTVSVRAYPAGSTAPSWQLTVKDSSADQITSSGGVGEWAYLSSSGVSTPFAFTNLQAWDLSMPMPQPAPTSSTPAPTPSAPSTSAAPTSSAPTTPAPPASSAPSTQPSSPTSAPPTTAPPTTTPPVVTPPLPSSTRGSAAVGSTAYPVPAGALFVAPSGDDSAAGSLAAPLRTVQAAINKAAAGQTIVLRAGIYHESVTVYKAGLTIQSYPDEAVWFDGSSVVTGWSHQGNNWVHAGWTNQFDHSASFSTGTNDPNFINPAYPMAAWPDQVFIDGAGQSQVSDSSQVSAGQFDVNYGARTITVGSDPSGHEVRSSDLMRALTVSAANVTLRGFGVRYYGTPLPQMAAVLLYGGTDTARDLVVTDNATQGMSVLYSGSVIDHVTVTRSGMTGIHGNEADNVTIENSLINLGNTENFNRAPSAGGIKITRSVGVTVENNSLLNNNSTGVWLDESIRRFTIANNSSIGNTKGFTTELSDTGIIANNDVDGGEYGLFVLDSGNIQIFNNAFHGITSRNLALIQDARRQAALGAVGRDPRMPVPDASCPWLVRNITVANNVFGSLGIYQLLVQDQQTGIPADSMNVVVNGNQFAAKVSSSDANMIGWGGNDNHTVVLYQTPAAFAAAKNSSWTNTQVSTVVANASSTAGSASAVPLPASVAAVIGVATNTKHVGTF